MKLKIKKLWLEALRSGKYKQTLRNKNGFCCLGVLCDLHGKKIKRKGWDKIAPKHPFTGYSYLNTTGVLPETVVNWSGITNNNPVVNFRSIKQSLAELNDEKKSFEWIADAIEQNL